MHYSIIEVLDNHIDKAYEILTKPEYRNNKNAIGIIVDNAGYELVTDLILGYGLIKLGLVDNIIFHTKAHPTFVSDATTLDCLETLNYLSGEENYPAIQEMSKNIQNLVKNGQIVFSDDLFWCQPTAFWDMSDRIIKKLSDHIIVFVKGDANYRRLIGERDWPLDTCASDILR